MLSKASACAPRSSCWEEMRQHIPSWPGGCCRKDTPSGIIAIRVHLSARCQLRKQRLKLIAASWPMSWPFTAKRRTRPATPFFRFPGFAANGALLARMNDRGFVVFGADVWASDWTPMGPERELRLILSRLERIGRGIVLFHDTKRSEERRV